MDILPQTILSSVCLEIDKWWWSQGSSLDMEESQQRPGWSQGFKFGRVAQKCVAWVKTQKSVCFMNEWMNEWMDEWIQ